MQSNVDTIRTLREAAKEAITDFKSSMNNLGRLKYDPGVGLDTLVHDNVRIVEATEDDFEFNLVWDKYQIVIALVGAWTLTHGKVARELHPTDIVKVPAGVTIKTTMKTQTAGNKFVYVQFTT